MAISIVESKDTIKGKECCKCGGKETSQWLRYYDKKGNWNGRSYICKICYNNSRYIIPKGYKENYIEYKKKQNNRKCCFCGSVDTYIGPNGYARWHNHDCDKKDCTKSLCHTCNNNDYQHNNPNSDLNVKKSIANRRTGNIYIDSQYYIEIVSEGVVAKFLNIENQNIKMDNFTYYIDMEDSEYGKINVKARRLSLINMYEVYDFHIKRNISCDTYFCLGFDEANNIDVVCIIPNEDWINELDSICIYKNSKKTSKYDQFKVDTNPYNDIYKDMRQFFKGKKYIGIDDIKEWFRSY